MFSEENQQVGMKHERANFSSTLTFVRGFPTFFHDSRDSRVTGTSLGSHDNR